MTQHRDLKKIIRERMKKTGERYSAARANVLRESGVAAGATATATQGLFAGYQPASGISSDTGCATNCINWTVGNGACASAFSEAMFTGLCGGIGFLYAVFEYKGYPPMLSVLGRYDTTPDSFLLGGLQRSGITFGKSESTSPSVAQRALESSMDAQSPALCTVDLMEVLPVSGPICATGMAPAIVAVCGAKGDDLLLDLGSGALRKVTREQFANMRASYRKGKNRLLSFSPGTGSPDLRGAIIRSVHDTAKRFLESPYKGFAANFGLAGLEKFQRLLLDPKDKKGWPALFGEGAAAYLGLRRLYVGVHQEYTAPAAGRPLYADFLGEAAKLTGSKPLLAAQKAFAKSGERWNAITDLVLHCGDPAVEEACREGESTWELMDSTATPQDPTIPVNLSDRLERMRSCKLTRKDTEPLFARIAELLGEIRDLEGEGVKALSAAK